MSHILLQYAPEDQEFAHHLAVQLEQRGLAIWPVPDPAQQPDATAPSPGAGRRKTWARRSSSRFAMNAPSQRH